VVFAPVAMIARRTLPVIARSPCDEAIQSFCVAPDCFACARNDVDRHVQNGVQWSRGAAGDANHVRDYL
jgi:hypothetical protein